MSSRSRPARSPTARQPIAAIPAAWKAAAKRPPRPARTSHTVLMRAEATTCGSDAALVVDAGDRGGEHGAVGRVGRRGDVLDVVRGVDVPQVAAADGDPRGRADGAALARLERQR